MSEKSPMPERSPAASEMLAAWLNVRVDQIPAESRAHSNPHCMAAWERVYRAAVAHHKKGDAPA